MEYHGQDSYGIARMYSWSTRNDDLVQTRYAHSTQLVRALGVYRISWISSAVDWHELVWTGVDWDGLAVLWT